MWTSLIQHADYVWLACRTDPEAPKHKGLSMVIVPTTAEGFSWTPVRTMSGPTTSATYYNDVRVPVSSLVGDLHGGWLADHQPRSNLRTGRALPAAAHLAARLRCARYTNGPRTPSSLTVVELIDQEWAQIPTYARVHAGGVQVLKLMNWRIVSPARPLACGRRVGEQGVRHRVRDARWHTAC